MWDALGLWRTKFFCSLKLTLFWANLNLVEFCLKSESGFKIISKVQLLQQTFVLKKKYSKYQLWDFWTESSLAQWKPNSTQVLTLSIFILSCHGAWVIDHILFILHEASLEHELLVILQFHHCVHDLILLPRKCSCEKKNYDFTFFGMQASSGEHFCREECLLGAQNYNQILWFLILWACFMSMQCNWKMTKHLWKIKNPILRAARLKIYYVDIFSNERCFKFVLDSTGDCKICGSVVSKSLQLLDCSNARRMWKICE